MARIGEEREVYRVLLRKPEEKRPLGRPRCRWEDGIRMDLRVIDWGLWSRFSWLRMGPIAGCYEYCHEPTSSGATDLVKTL
jgi:hypothetical protein